ncbi:MAG: L-threonylcarbamoyladenylate synthase [Bdellovibrionales bacterium]|nr:L-threonylcarbamoyladenylate synthase [Bdellovibrionales bacterium]
MLGTKVSFQQACSIIKNGGVVAVPTETVYGLAGDFKNINAIKQIFQIKKRPLWDPLIIHFSSKKELKKLCKYSDPIVEKLSDYFHPGPLTLVLRKNPIVSDLITAGSSKVAIRMPRHPLTLKLMTQTNTCLVAPSANVFSKTSPTRADHVLESLQVPVLNGGPCEVGIESTILEVCFEKKIFSILRPGFIGPKELNSFISRHQLNWKVQQSQSSSFPGSHQKHYQPDIPLILIQTDEEHLPSEGIEKKIKEYYPDCIPQELQLKNNPYIFGREFYHNLKQLSKNKNSVGYIVQKSKSGQCGEDWTALWDRIEKASDKVICY